MNYFGYERIVQEQLEDFKATNRPIVLFGTLEMAIYAKKSIHFLDKSITCFCDNNQDKWGTTIHNIIIMSPEQVKDKYPDAKIYICSFNRNNIIQIKQQLLDMGFNDVYNSDMLFYVYQIYLMRRPILSSDLANTMEVLNNPKDKLIIGEGIGNFPVIVTEKCNLRCRDCGVMIPYYKNPKHYDKDFIIESIKSLAACVDVIETINIIGGETFLYPDLVEVCTEVAKINNIFKIIIATNGTIVPEEEIIAELKKSIAYVIISDYGELSKNKQELKKVLEKCELFYEDFSDDVPWTKFYLPKKHNRTPEENTEIFLNCKWAGLLSKMINGEFHLCDFSAGLSPFKVIPDNDKDYVNILDGQLSITDKRKRIHDLLYEKDFLAACDYCELYKLETTPRAIQVKGILEF